MSTYTPMSNLWPDSKSGSTYLLAIELLGRSSSHDGERGLARASEGRGADRLSSFVLDVRVNRLPADW